MTTAAKIKVGDRVRRKSVHTDVGTVKAIADEWWWIHIDREVGPASCRATEWEPIPPAPQWPERVTLVLSERGDVYFDSPGLLPHKIVARITINPRELATPKLASEPCAWMVTYPNGGTFLYKLKREADEAVLTLGATTVEPLYRATKRSIDIKPHPPGPQRGPLGSWKEVG